jgi:hypothetical protein
MTETAAKVKRWSKLYTVRVGLHEAPLAIRVERIQNPEELGVRFGNLYLVTVKGRAAGYVRSHWGPGVQSGDCKWFDWIPLGSEGMVAETWAKSMVDILWERGADLKRAANGS